MGVDEARFRMLPVHILARPIDHLTWQAGEPGDLDAVSERFVVLFKMFAVSSVPVVNFV